MADVMSKAARSRLMTAVRGRGNVTTELALMRQFRASQIQGWRRHYTLHGCRPDFVFARQRVAVFADGCFWHGCPVHYTKPATSASFWRSKVEANRARDQRHARTLRRFGWSVWRVWECRIRENRLPTGLLRKLAR